MSRRKFRVLQVVCHIIFLLMLLAPALTAAVSAQSEDTPGALERLLNLTWDGLDNPLALGLFCAAFLQLIGKGIIEWLRCQVAQLLHLLWPSIFDPTQHLPDDWLIRSPLYNILVFAGAWLILYFHDISGGPAFVTALLSAASAIGEYEVIKNLVRLVGGDITVLGWKWCH